MKRLIIALCAIGLASTAQAEEKFHPERYSAAALAQISFGCQAWDDFMAVKNAAASGNKTAAVALIMDRCTPLMEGTVVYIEDRSVWYGAFQVRRKGSLVSYWMPSEIGWAAVKDTAGDTAKK